MFRAIAIGACLCFFASTASAQTGKSDRADVNSAASTKGDKQTPKDTPHIVFDPATSNVLSHHAAGAPWYPASLTKLMTALLIFEDIKAGKYTLKDKLTVSKYANSMPPSKLGAPVGSKLRVDFSLKVLLVRSTNDIAVALAEHSEGSVSAFARRMNETATRLGMSASYFANPHGLPDPRQVTSARDMALLGATILKNFPEYDSYFSARNVKIGKKRFRNRNRLLRQWKPADGMKTGYICNSGFNLVASATQNGRQLVAVVLGSKGGVARADKAKLLLEEGFAAYGPDGQAAQAVPMSEIRNVAVPGEGLPRDMAPVVCKRRGPFKETAPSVMRDAWGIALGKFEKGSDANLIVERRLRSSHGLFQGGKGAVIRMPDKSGYLSVVGRLSEAQSRKICSEMVAQDRTCQLLSPEFFEDLDGKYRAALAADRERRRKAAAKRRAKKKRKKKK
ncbi:MAG: D-alanyl-D-alanine carboxypeptidase family protein [Hyphomicrobiales bacterium]